LIKLALYWRSSTFWFGVVTRLTFAGGGSRGEWQIREHSAAYRHSLAAMFISMLLNFAAPAVAQWKVQEGRNAFSLPLNEAGKIATLPARAPAQGITANLQLECVRYLDLSSLYFGVITSKEMLPGFMGWRFRYDQEPEVERSPSIRTSLTKTSLGDPSKEELKGLMKAKRLRLTLLPPNSALLRYDFDVAGAAEAAARLPC
jgi:hypothetical protein